ncbi:uncharacterized protein LOC142634926 [Castanea sativa]|uniref:uncharacterized protein LOC142634926 n=1 Tax=Castanea sativa TaxID=21020 RepID=UPI003F650E96
MAKQYKWRLISPKTLLLENVRADFLIDAEHGCWRANLACGLVIDRECTFEDMFWKLSNGSRPSAMDLTHFMVVSWNIWNNINGIQHGEKPKTVATLILEATRLVVDYQSIQDYPIPSTNSPPTRWTPPIIGVYKSNVDGVVFRDQSTAGMGVLLRDDKGQVVGALSLQIYAPLGPLEAEAKAMEAVVIFARDIGIQDVIFEGDSLQVCNAMNGCSLAPPTVANVLEGIFL